MYRKYLEPEYGKVAPEVEIMAPQVMDMNNRQLWRQQSDYESLAAMTAAYQKCNIYPEVMGVMTEDILCDFGNGPFRVRVYQPPEESGKGLKEKKPVLVYYHGGSFSFNSIEVYEYVCRYLCMTGEMLVVAPDYHLAPEHPFPRGLEEAYQTLRWAKEHVEDYGGDPENLNVGGDSSGGNFAAVVSMMARERKGPDIKGQYLVYPLVCNKAEELTESEKRYGRDHFLEYRCTEDPMALYFTRKEERKDPYASPLLAEDLSGLPRACIVLAECDPLLDQGLMYAAKLEDAGVPVECHVMKGMLHGFLNWTYGKSFEAMEYGARFVRGQGKM